MKIAVISYNPVEKYPPLRNLMQDEHWSGHAVRLYSAREGSSRLPEFSVSGIHCVRPAAAESSWRIVNLWRRLWFAFRVWFHLMLWRPEKILYVESNSALPVFAYWLLHRDVELYVHYYEYFDPELFRAQLWDHFCHRLEFYFYSQLKWCSHCNSSRLEMFCRDTGIPAVVGHVIPNYPPHSWRNEKRHRYAPGSVIRTVSLGTLSEKTMYVAEYAQFIKSQGGKITWDIYAFQYSKAVVEEIESLHCPWIVFHRDGVLYSDIPKVLPQYDVGLILYKPCTKNVQYGENNKFYEYLCCGLDVWFPPGFPLLKKYENIEMNPWIRMVDFSNLENFSPFPNPDCARENLPERPFEQWAENAALPLWEVLL